MKRFVMPLIVATCTPLLSIVYRKNRSLLPLAF